jgi:CheY-like chemotaxis protein
LTSIQVEVHGVATVAGGLGKDATPLELAPPRKSVSRGITRLGPAAKQSMRAGAQAARLIRILVVDDDPSIRYLLRLILEGEGYEILEAGQGEAALEMIRVNPVPDIVMTDLMMPVMGGVDLIHRLRAEPRTAAIPIVVVSSNAEAAQSLQASGLVNAIVSKPFTAVRLADHIRAVAGNPTSGQPMESRG